MAGSRAQWTVLRRHGVSWQAKLAVPEKLQRLDPGSPKIQQDSEETPNSWALQQMVEFPGPDSSINRGLQAASSHLIRAPRKTESRETTTFSSPRSFSPSFKLSDQLPFVQVKHFITTSI
ncbi:hypothetical protein DUI87_18799 [Hirundo rustica rustica]|uniref:Uncharacterized protein n=1 Tax=Hirundo rustica rustica TaxID=333673 RepID=A0A3M0JZG0_HIRRU|nr:hypothetical protein DUI87_18799 [Hirundo rustica rustica]